MPFYLQYQIEVHTVLEGYSFYAKRWESGLIAEYYDSGDDDHSTGIIPMNVGSVGKVLVWGGGATLDANGWKTIVWLPNTLFDFTSNEIFILCDLPWEWSTPRTV